MLLMQALRYPFQKEGSWRTIVKLALVQLFPIVGQLMLLGYGFEVVHAMYAGKPVLPPVHWLSALKDGFHLLLAGCLYLLPIVLTVGIMGASSIGLSSGLEGLGDWGILLAVGLPMLVIFVGAAVVKRGKGGSKEQIVEPKKRKGAGALLLVGLLPAIAALIKVFVLGTLLSLPGVRLGEINWFTALLAVLVIILLFLIYCALFIGGVRHALVGKGIFAATSNAKLLFKNRALSSKLLVNFLLLNILAFIGTAIGLVFFVVPGLMIWVICSLASWYLFTDYCIKVVGSKHTDYLSLGRM